MSQNTSVESSTRSSPNPSINPALQAALGCLDVQLEEELARYRRQRAGRPVMSSRGLRRHQARKPLELISIEQPTGQTQQRALGMSTAPVMSFPLDMGNQASAATPSKTVIQEPVTQTGQLDMRSSAALESNNALVFPSPTQSTGDNSGNEPGFTEQLTPRQPGEGEGNFSSLAADQTPPDDYLESSEKLLQSLSEDEETVQPKKRTTNKLLTPLGIGSILLLLLSSATLVYLVAYRSTFTALGLNRLFGAKTQNTAPSSTETTADKRESAKDAPIAHGPNLASEEFVDLDLNTLSHLPPSPTASALSSPRPTLPTVPNSGAPAADPPVVPNTALPGRSSNLPSTLLPPSGQMGTVPSTVAPLTAPGASALRVNTQSSASAKQGTSSNSAASAATQQPQASTSGAGVATNTTSVGESFYYVLVNDTSDRAIEKAKTVVPDAYVENFPQGARVQMGAFQTESEAKTLVQELQQQGISATIYRP
ncbi:MAG: SPOR domain-containing protein [Coleofasciculus sp. Co-bin14]|nr:SPOR domain-containing protein [Coleofasciculus sp. Co-bin14]